MNIRYLFLFLVFAVFHFGCKTKAEETTPSTFILNETFVSNKIGWAEEYTKAHLTEIKNGFLYINSLDTSAIQSSNGPLDNSFLLNFPDNYQITSSISLMKHSGNLHFGIILVGSSVEYKFSVSDSGTAAVIEWDYNRSSEMRLFTHDLYGEKDLSKKAFLFEINVHFRNFEFYINDKLMGEGILNSKNWRNIRLFTTSGSTIAVDYLRIKDVE